MSMRRSSSDEVKPQVAAEAAEWFTLLQEENASERDFQDWQRWLMADPEHGRAYRQVERAWQLIGEVGDPLPSGREQAGRLARGGREAGLQWGWAAGILVSVLLAAAAYWFTARGEVYSTRTAEQRSIRLADGSRVTLGARSRITLHFSGEARRIRLDSGEAYFEVARDPARPFTVKAGESEVRVLGTAFNVRTNRDRILVSVTEGRVAVAAAGADKGTNAAEARNGQTVICAGQQTVVTREGAIEPPAPAPAEVTWLQGRFEYRGEALRHVVDDLNRYTDRPILFANAAAGGLRYTGTVFPDRLEEWLQGIGGALPVVVRNTGRRWEIHLAGE